MDEEDFAPMLMEIEDDSDDSDWSDEEMEEVIPESSYKLDKKSKIPDRMKQFFNNSKKMHPLEYFKLPQAQPVTRQVCAKVIGRNDEIVECFDCQVDRTCVICLDCFKHGNHEGHRYVIKKAYGGCCDCGDSEAWNPEGFCTRHSGKFKDFQIPQDVQESFNRIIDDIMFCYFYGRISGSAKCNPYTKVIMQFLITINSQNLYYNKLTAISLNRPLPPEYVLCKELKNRTILENILTFRVSGRDINDWFDFFMTLFPYYPLKNWLVEHYMKNYQLLIDGSELAISMASVLACQLLTSHQLIKNYVENNNVGLGETMKLPKDLGKLENVMFSIFTDLKHLSELTGQASGLYWRMHIESGMDNLFGYYYILKKKLKHFSADLLNNKTLVLTQYISFSQVQFGLLALFPRILNSIQHFPETIISLMKYLLNKVRLEDTECPLILFRPYERALGVVFFSYFSFNLSNITHESVEELRLRLEISEEEMAITLNSAFKRMIKTFLLYSKSIAESGLQSTLYAYLYFYKIKSRFISVLDILTLKILILFPQVSSGLSFLKQVQYDSTITYEDTQIKSKQIYLTIILKELGLLYTSKSYEIFLAYETNKNCQLFLKDIEQMINEILIQNKGTLSLQQFNILKEHMFHKQVPLDQIIKKFTKFDKKKKMFVSLNPVEGSGINFSDYRVNIDKDSSYFQNPQKTAAFIHDYNITIFNKLWNEQGTKNVIKAFTELEGASKTKDDGIRKGLVSSFSTLAYIQNKNQNQNFVLIVKKILDQPEYKQLIPTQYLKCMNLISMPVQPIQSQMLEEEDTLKLKRLKTKQQKLMKMKAKSQLILESQNLIDEEPKDQLMCCICKNTNPQHFVYLGNASVRNHEKLMNLGEGIQIIAFSSCFHVFDVSCLKKKFKSTNTSIACPLCKASSNILIPLEINKKNTETFMERFTKIILSCKDSPDINQELIKSIYHYILMGEVDLQNCFQKKVKVYRLIWDILTATIKQKQINELFKKFTSHKFSAQLNKKLHKVKKPKKSGLLEFLRGFIQEQAEQMNGEQEYELEEFGNLPFLFQSSQSMQQDKSPEKEKSEVEKAQEENLINYSCLFEGTMLEVFRLLKQEKNELEEDINPLIKICMNTLVDPNQGSPLFPHPIQRSLFRELPLYYTPLGSIKQCVSCGQLSSDLMMCLLCNWTGCQKCSGGDVLQHVKSNHGHLGAFMYIQKGLTCCVVGDILVPAGHLYQDQFGRGLKINKNWDDFELNIPLKQKMQRSLLYDEISLPKYSLYL